MGRLFSVFLVFLYALYAGPAFADFDSEALRQTDDAHVRINTACTYSIISVRTGEILLKIPMRQTGNGYFVEHPLNPRTVVTAGHVIDCSRTPEEVASIFKSIIEKKTLAVLQTQTSVFVAYKGAKYGAKIFKFASEESKPDFAVLLDVDMPADVQYYKLPVLLEEVYKKYDEVIVKGFLPFGDTREQYLKRTLISKLDNQIFQFSEVVYSGMSGSPVLFYYQGRYHAIGIIFAGGFWQQNEVRVPVELGLATRLKKDFFEPDQTAPK